MLNTSILALNAILLSKAPFSLAQSHQKRSLFVSNSHFSQALNGVFRFNHQLSQTAFRHSTFNKIIGQAIALDTAAYKFIDSLISIRIDLNLTFSETVLVDSCMFSHCLAIQKQFGGALCISSQTPVGIGLVNIQYCSFFGCVTSDGEGGAVFTHVSSSHILYSCFFSCNTRTNVQNPEDNAGQAAYIMNDLGASAQSSLILNGVSFVQCPGKDVSHSTTVVYAALGNQDIDDCNFTDNYIQKASGGLHSDLSIHFNMKSVNFINNTGDCICALNNLEKEDTISYCNMIDNTLRTENEKCLFYVLCTEPSYGFPFDHIVFVQSSAPDVFAFGGQEQQQQVVLTNCIFQKSFDHFKLEDVSSWCTVQYRDKNNTVADSPATNPVTVFNSEECWYIEPPKYPAGAASNLFYVFLILFIGVVGAGIFFQIRSFSNGMTYSTNPAAPIIATKDSYESIE